MDANICSYAGDLICPPIAPKSSTTAILPRIERIDRFALSISILRIPSYARLIAPSGCP